MAHDTVHCQKHLATSYTQTAWPCNLLNVQRQYNQFILSNR